MKPLVQLQALDENLKSRRSGVQGDEEAQTGVSNAEGES